MNKKKSLLIVIAMAVLCIGAVTAFVLVLLPKSEPVEVADETTEPDSETVAPPEETTGPEESEDETFDPEETTDIVTAPPLLLHLYQSQIDFDYFHSINPDIFAYLIIRGTPIAYPVVNRANDDSYYLRRDYLENYNVKGSIFVESKNHLDFNDPCTIIYGHTTPYGDFFGSLEGNYSKLDFMKQNSEINVYLEDKQEDYIIYGSTVHDDEHLLYAYDFSDEDSFNAFFGLLRLSDKSVYNKDVTPQFGDRILILSTCLYESLKHTDNHRFLVVAVSKTDLDRHAAEIQNVDTEPEDNTQTGGETVPDDETVSG